MGKLLEEQRATLGGPCTLLCRLFFPKLSTPFVELCGLVSWCRSVYSPPWSSLQFIRCVSFPVWMVRVLEGCASFHCPHTVISFCLVLLTSDSQPAPGTLGLPPFSAYPMLLAQWPCFSFVKSCTAWMPNYPGEESWTLALRECQERT